MKIFQIIFWTFFWIFIAIVLCLLISLLFCSPTICMNYNLEIKTKHYSNCVDNKCIYYNKTDIYYDLFWLNCQRKMSYTDITDDFIKNIEDMIISENDTTCYYNYLAPCQLVSNDKIPTII